MVYELFLQKYPNHNLAPSAKFELDNMGKDPTEVLKNNVVLQETAKPNVTKGKRRK